MHGVKNIKRSKDVRQKESQKEWWKKVLEQEIRLGGQGHVPVALLREKDTVLIVQKARWAPGSVWTGAENLAPTWSPPPDHPACSESL
jgi:hypothetical protein